MSEPHKFNEPHPEDAEADAKNKSELARIASILGVPGIDIGIIIVVGMKPGETGIHGHSAVVGNIEDIKRVVRANATAAFMGQKKGEAIADLLEKKRGLPSVLYSMAVNAEFDRLNKGPHAEGDIRVEMREERFVRRSPSAPPSPNVTPMNPPMGGG